MSAPRVPTYATATVDFGPTNNPPFVFQYEHEVLEINQIDMEAFALTMLPEFCDYLRHTWGRGFTGLIGTLMLSHESLQQHPYELYITVFDGAIVDGRVIEERVTVSLYKDNRINMPVLVLLRDVKVYMDVHA